MITGLPWRPLKQAEWLRECAARAAIGAHIQKVLSNTDQAAALAATVVELTGGIRQAAEFQIIFDSDVFGADALSVQDWQRGCDALNAAVSSHVQALANVAYEAVTAGFYAGLKARILD